MQLDDLKVKMDLLSSENVEQQKEIIALKAKMDTNPSSRSFSKNERDSYPINIDDISFTNRKSSSGGKYSVRSVSYPSSCDELATIGHSLDGFYLVKNPTTGKIETVFCDFVTSGKLKIK